MNRDGFEGRKMGGECFRPPLVGVVAKDLSLAHRLNALYSDTCRSVLALMERSLFCVGSDFCTRELFEELSETALEEARLVGELTVALGGTAVYSARSKGRRRGSFEEARTAVLRTTAAESRRRIETYETLLSSTGDRVVRSVLTRLITSERRMEARANEGG